MRLLLVPFAFVLMSTAFSVEVSVGYHEKAGIPLAKKIKAAEDAIFARQSQDTQDARIVGGAVAPINAHPYLGGLVINFVGLSDRSACGSSLLSTNRLVTAAHCWNDGEKQGSQFEVVLGSAYLFYGGTRIVTSTVIMHPSWNPNTLQNDVAMIYLPWHVFYSAAIQPVALPNIWEISETFNGEWAIASGYGKTNDIQQGVSLSTVVSDVHLQVITFIECFQTFQHWVQSSNICTSGAGGVGICSGDSGGPLVINRNRQNILVGISSFVADLGCQLRYPSVFARVTSFYNFIIQHLYL